MNREVQTQPILYHDPAGEYQVGQEVSYQPGWLRKVVFMNPHEGHIFGFTEQQRIIVFRTKTQTLDIISRSQIV